MRLFHVILHKMISRLKTENNVTVTRNPVNADSFRLHLFNAAYKCRTFQLASPAMGTEAHATSTFNNLFFSVSRLSYTSTTLQRSYVIITFSLVYFSFYWKKLEKVSVFTRSICISCHYRAMLCVRGTTHGPVSVRPSFCPSQVGVLSKRLNESSWFFACELPSTRPTLF